MTNEEIRNHIYITLANLYEKPMHRHQFKQFTFEPSDQPLAKDVIADMLRSLIIDQIQPWVIRLTGIGYTLIQRDLNRIRAEESGSYLKSETAENILAPPSQEEIFSISNALMNPDCISASRFTKGKSEIFWATESFKDVTGYSIKELKDAGGSIAMIQDAKKLKQMAIRVFSGQEIKAEVEIITQSGHRKEIDFVARPRYDSDGQIAGTISAMKVK